MRHALNVLAIVLLLASCPRPAAAVSETYLFRDSFAPEEGAANVLVPVSNATGTIVSSGPDFINGSFVTESISAAACASTPSVRAWSFLDKSGLYYPNATPTVVTGSYTISMLMRYDPMDSGYARLIDFSNSTLDTGIYKLSNEVSFYPVGTFAAGSFVQGQDVFVTITRDAGTQLVSLYINGVPSGTYTDTTNLYAPSATVVYFLMDNTTGSANIGETDPGTIAYLQIRDVPITADEVAASLATICQVVSESTTTTTTLPPTTTTIAPSLCGNGAVDPGEQCDLGAAVNGTPGVCCTATCAFRPADGECRPAADPCDIAETCTGNGAACPADARKNAGDVCDDEDPTTGISSCNGSGACTGVATMVTLQPQTPVPPNQSPKRVRIPLTLAVPGTKGKQATARAQGLVKCSDVPPAFRPPQCGTASALAGGGLMMRVTSVFVRVTPPVRRSLGRTAARSVTMSLPLTKLGQRLFALLASKGEGLTVQVQCRLRDRQGRQIDVAAPTTLMRQP